MKKIFTLLAAAAVVASAGAITPKALQNQKGELSAMGAHKLLTTASQVTADHYAGITRPGQVKRSYTQGTLTYELIMVIGGNLGQYFNGAPTIEQLPYYGVEYILTAYNASDVQVSMIPVLLAWPTKYMYDLIDWDGPTVEVPDGQGGTELDIPDELKDLSPVSLSWFVDHSEYYRRFFNTYDGYIMLSVVAETPGALWDGPYAYGMWGFSGAKYNQKDIQLYTDWTIENQNGDCSKIEFESYSLDDDTFEDTNYFTFEYTTGGKSQLNLNYSGWAYIQGFEAKNVSVPMTELHIFNAGILDGEEMGDTYPFYEYPEENLQMYYIMACDENIQIGHSSDQVAEIEKDPTFSTDKVGFFLSANGNPEESYFYYGYLFNALNTRPENMQWNYKAPTTFEYEEYGQTITLYDWLTPTANMFVGPRELYSETEYSPWSLQYGVKVVRNNGYLCYPTKESNYMAANTANGFVFNFNDQFDNNIYLPFDGTLVFHGDYEDMTVAEEINAKGNFVPENSAVKNIMANLSGLRVSAANGRIAVTSMEGADVQIFSLNGNLVKAAHVNAGNTLNVEAAKGLYIVKAGKEVRKVVL